MITLFSGAPSPDVIVRHHRSGSAPDSFHGCPTPYRAPSSPDRAGQREYTFQFMQVPPCSRMRCWPQARALGRVGSTPRVTGEESMRLFSLPAIAPACDPTMHPQAGIHRIKISPGLPEWILCPLRTD